MLEKDIYWMEQALALAHIAKEQNEVPVGAILVRSDKIIGKGWNQPIKQNDPTAHAEIIALRAGAAFLENYRLLQTTLYVTLEPCSMCIGAMLHARIERLIFGAFDPKTGAVQSTIKMLELPTLNHKISWQGGILEKECSTILKDFFKNRRT